MTAQRSKHGTPLQSEDAFLALVDHHFPEAGRGDDAVILGARGPACLSTDLFVENVHFRTAYFPPEAVGRKGLAVNLSDMAAMGARPTGFALSLMIPQSVDTEYLDALLGGMASLAGQWNVPLVGGDLSRGPVLGLSITIWGEPGPSGALLTRNAGPAGSTLFVVGPIGLARTGLACLEQDHYADCAETYPNAVLAHLDPEPKIDAGLLLASHPGVHGLMDVSDGLARDLPRLLGHGTDHAKGAGIQIDPATLHPEITAFVAAHRAEEQAPQHGLDPTLAFAIQGGEDYALLGAATPDAVAELAEQIDGLRPIGRVTDSPSILINGYPLDDPGFDHFG